MTDLRVILVGGGRVGYHVAEDLADAGHAVVVVERNEERCRRLADAYFATVIEGDGARPDVLAQADPESADVIAGLTPNPGANLAACFIAERQHPGIRTVLRVTSSEGEAGYGELVDETVFPERAGAHVATNAVVGADIQALGGYEGELDIVDVEVAADAPVAGKQLLDVALPHGSLVISAGESDRIADSETVLEPGRRYLVAVEPAVADEVRQLFHG